MPRCSEPGSGGLPAADDAEEPPTSPKERTGEFGRKAPDQRPTLDARPPRLGGDGAEGCKQPLCAGLVVELRDGAVRAVRVHACPLHVTDPAPSSGDLTVVAQALLREPGQAGENRHHEGGPERSPKHLSQRHDLDVVVDRRPVVDHDAERATWAQHAVDLPGNRVCVRSVMDNTEAVHMVEALIREWQLPCVRYLERPRGT